jgi:hypothetical protein
MGGIGEGKKWIIIILDLGIDESEFVTLDRLILDTRELELMALFNDYGGSAAAPPRASSPEAHGSRGKRK